jgi:hypothetical protein
MRRLAVRTPSPAAATYLLGAIDAELTVRAGDTVEIPYDRFRSDNQLPVDN